MSTHTHVLRLPKRTATVTVTELADRVRFHIHFTAVGDFGDQWTFAAWLRPIIEKYDGDPRPTEVVNGRTGETAIVVEV